jgi:hypothetical protein
MYLIFNKFRRINLAWYNAKIYCFKDPDIDGRIILK